MCYRLPPEERQLSTSLNPMCEVFPKGDILHHEEHDKDHNDDDDDD